MKKIILIIISLSLITACATSNKSGNSRLKIYDAYIVENQLKSLNRVRTFKMQNWKELDSKHLILSSFHKKQYLITFKNICNDLSIAPSIALKQSMNNSLSAKFDAVIVSTTPVNLTCYINSIHELTREQEQEVLDLKKSNK